MEYINIHASTIDSDEFQSADCAQAGAWLFLLRYLCGQEKGERIVGAKEWSPLKWVRACSVPHSIVFKDSPLWAWDGADLVLRFYPHDQEAKTRALRVAGARGGRQAQATLKAKLERNGTEGNGTEGKVGSEVPSELEVREFCKTFTDLSRGIEGIPEVWWTGWYARRLASSYPFPARWRDVLTMDHRSDWMDPNSLGHTKARAGLPQKKTAREKGEILQALGLAQKNGDLREIEALKRELEAAQ